MKTGTRKLLDEPSDNNFEDHVSTRVHVKKIELRIQYQFLVF